MKKLRIIQDASMSNSPLEWDNLGTMAYKHRNYCLGHEEISDPIDWLSGMTGSRVNGYNNEELERQESIFFDKFVALPLYLYDHSGITMNTSGFTCRWDSGKVGYIYISLEKIRQEYSVKRVSKKLRDRVREYLKNEVNTFDQFIRGEVYGFILEEDGEQIDSCWGFYGYDWETNGIKDHLPEEVWDQLENVEIETNLKIKQL